MRLPRLFALSAALLLASACLNDRPVVPKDAAALALRVALPESSPGKQTVQLVVSYYPYNDRRVGALGQYDLFDHTYHTEPGYTRIAANFSLADCLQYFAPDALGPYCDVNIDVTLREDSVFVDEQTIYGLRVRPGVTTQADSLFLGGNSAPVVSDVTPGALVEPDLVRFSVSASDANGDIAGLLARMTDSSDALPDSTRLYFSQPVGNLNGSFSLYATAPPRARDYSAQLFDAQGNVSVASGAGINALPQASPYITFMQTSTTADSVFVTAYWGGPTNGGMKAIDFVVRTYPGNSSADTIYMVCTIVLTDQSSLVQGQCPRTGPAFSHGDVVAVPVDSSDSPGYAEHCDLGDNCGGVIVPRRHRR